MVGASVLGREPRHLADLALQLRQLQPQRRHREAMQKENTSSDCQLNHS
jgi:hypothetical protein